MCMCVCMCVCSCVCKRRRYIYIYIIKKEDVVQRLQYIAQSIKAHLISMAMCWLISRMATSSLSVISLNEASITATSVSDLTIRKFCPSGVRWPMPARRNPVTVSCVFGFACVCVGFGGFTSVSGGLSLSQVLSPF